MTPRVAAYVRVSTDKQASDEHYSIPAQTARLKAYCTAKGWNLVRIYTDPGYSGKSLERPAIQQLIRECKQYDIILVNKLDRLSRSQKDTLHLIEDVFRANGVQFVSMSENFDTSTPLGMAMIGILSTFAQLEREQIKERMMTGQKGRAKKGLFHGSDKVPVGYIYKDGHLIVDEEGAELVREVYNLFLSGKSLRQIGKIMREKSDRITWDGKSISRMLQNPVYLGKIVHRDETYDGEHPAIIDPLAFDRATQGLVLMSRNAMQYRNPSHKLLSGFIWCGECGSRYGITYSHANAKGKKYRYEYYQCYHRRYGDESGCRCSNKTYRREVLDDYIKTAVLNLDFEKIDAPEQAERDHTKEIARLEKQKSKLVDLYAIDGINLEDLQKKIAAIDAKLLPLVTPAEKKIPIDHYKAIREKAKEVFESGSADDQRAIITSMIKKISIYRDRIQIEWIFS